ncbi:MAG: VOC family protein [Planctomycetota bacterium]
MSEIPYIPENCNTLNTYLFVDDGDAAIDFYVKAFGGVAEHVMKGPEGSVMHASIQIGNSSLMISQANPEWGTKSPKELGGSPAMIHLYVPDADATFRAAIESGCTEVGPMMDCFWGERMGKVQDPFGFQWGISTQKEIVPPEELQTRADEWMKKMSG